MHTLPEDNIPLSATPSSSNNLAELVARKAEVDILRRELNQQQDDDGADTPDSGSRHNTNMLDNKLSQLEAKIDEAVDNILNEWGSMKEQFTSAESVKMKAISAQEKAVAALEQSEHTVDMLQEKCSQYECKVAELQSDVDTCSQHADSFAHEVLHLESTLAQAQRESREKSRQLESSADQLKKMNEQRHRLEATIDLLYEDYRNATERIVDVEEELDLVREELKELKGGTGAEETYKKIKAPVDRVVIEDYGDATEIVRCPHDDTVKQLNEMLREAKTETDDAMLIVDALTTRCNDLSDKMETLNVKVVEFEDRNGTLQTRMAELEDRNDESEASAQRLSQKLETLRTEKANLKDTLAAQTKIEEQLREKVRQVMACTDANAKQMVEEAASSQEDISRLTTEIYTLKVEIDELKEENESLLQEADDTFSEIENKRKSDLRRRSSLMDREDSPDLSELQKQIKVLFERERMLQEMNRLLENQKVVAIAIAKKDLTTKNEVLQYEVDLLKGRVKSLLKSRVQSSSEEEDLIYRNKALAHELTALKDQIHVMDIDLKAVPTLEAMIEDQAVELEQNDILISSLRDKIKRMENDTLERSPSLNGSSNPQSPTRRSPPRLGTRRQEP